MKIYISFTGSSTWVILAVTLVILLYRYGTRTFEFFKRQGIPGPKPLPFIGNVWGSWRQDMQKTDLGLVQKYGKVFGYFTGPTPTLFTTDPELIQLVYVKDFEHFSDKRPEISGLKSKYFRRFIGFILGGSLWKDVRSSMSLAFTSSKISQMADTFIMSANNLTERLRKAAATTGRIDRPKLVFGSFMKDAVCNCVMGSQEMGSDEYTEKAFTATNIPLLRSPLIAINFMFPGIRDWLPVKMREGRIVNQNLYIFLNIMKKQIRNRWESGQTVGDFIDTATASLFSAKKDAGNGEYKRMWTREDAEEILVAQGGGFVVAGFETAYSILFACIYNLAKHPEIQELFYNQLCEKFEEHGGEFSMALVKQVTYADCIIKEALRMHPPVKRITRQCTKDISYGEIHFKKGMIVSCPLYALHRLEENFQQPDKFIPDRWLPENAGQVKPYTYLPFGAGPRLCIGQRFAMHEIRVALCASILNCRFFFLPETPNDLLFDTSANPVGSPLDLPLGVEARTRNINHVP